MNIISAFILTGTGCDKVFLTTDLPEATWPYNGNQKLRFDVAAGNGREYVHEHFHDVPIELVHEGGSAPTYRGPGK